MMVLNKKKLFYSLNFNTIDEKWENRIEIKIYAVQLYSVKSRNLSLSLSVEPHNTFYINNSFSMCHPNFCRTEG